MSKRQILRQQIADLDLKIVDFYTEYAAQEYIKFIQSDGCITCDGTGVQELGWTYFVCLTCKGKTISHPLSFYSLVNKMPVKNFTKWQKAVELQFNKTRDSIFIDATSAEFRRQLTIQREALYKELLAAPHEPVSTFLPGDVVFYQNVKHTVIHIQEGTNTSDILTLKRQDVNSRVGISTATSDEVQLVSSLSDKLPKLKASFPQQFFDAQMIRATAIIDGKPNAMKEAWTNTSALFWIKTYGPDSCNF